MPEGLSSAEQQAIASLARSADGAAGVARNTPPAAGSGIDDAVNQLRTLAGEDEAAVHKGLLGSLREGYKKMPTGVRFVLSSAALLSAGVGVGFALNYLSPSESSTPPSSPNNATASVPTAVPTEVQIATATPSPTATRVDQSPTAAPTFIPTVPSQRPPETRTAVPSTPTVKPTETSIPPTTTPTVRPTLTVTPTPTVEKSPTPVATVRPKVNPGAKLPQ